MSWIISWEIWLPETFPAKGLHHMMIDAAKMNIWRSTSQLVPLHVSINDLSGVSPFEHVVSEMLLTFCHGLLGCKNWIPFEYHWHQWKLGIFNLWEDLKQKKAGCGVLLLLGLFVCFLDSSVCLLVWSFYVCFSLFVCLFELVTYPCRIQYFHFKHLETGSRKLWGKSPFLLACSDISPVWKTNEKLFSTKKAFHLLCVSSLFPVTNATCFMLQIPVYL